MPKCIRFIFNITVLILSVLHSSANSAQLVDSLPTSLELNWEVCQHFNAEEPQCMRRQLPLDSGLKFPGISHQTFTKDIILSSGLKSTTIGIYLENIDDVDEIYVNDQLVGKTGQFLPQFESGFRYQRLYLIPHQLLLFNQFNRLHIKTFSSRGLAGIQTQAPIIGDYLSLQHKIQEQDYAYIISATILLLLTIFQLFYFIVLKDNYETLYCTMFLLGFMIISLVRSQIPLDFGLDLSVAFKLESLMFNFSIISITLFMFNFFELEFRKFYLAGIYLMGIPGLVLIVWPYSINLRMLAEINYWILIACTFSVIGGSFLIAIHKQRKYAFIITATFCIGWFVLVYDAIMSSAALFEFNLAMHKQIVPLVSAITGIILSLTLTHKYWRFFKGSTYDHLTGTLLRPAFFQRLSEEMQRSQRGNTQLLVAVIDIQQAKKLSINYSYSLGNHLLSSVSNSLTKVLRPFDLICRFNDEQFCIAASIIDNKDADSCIKRIYEELIGIEQPIEETIDLYVDARIGGVLYNGEHHLTVSHLIQDANYALSKAKSQSRNNYLLIQNPTATA